VNKTLNIIPTPKYCQYESGKPLRVCRVCVIGETSDVLQNALDALAKVSPFSFCREQDAELVIYTDFSMVPAALPDTEDLQIFEEKFAKGQGYILKTAPNGQIVILGHEQVGCAYGVLTLRQMIGLPVGAFTIRDNPDFYFRGIKWLIWAETGAWSHDFGDGVENIIRRMKRNLDQLFLYKINYVYMDGFGFSTDRFEGYTKVMQTVTDYARKRGIRVAAGGYAMSYGMTGHLNSYQGKDFYNRKSYPDGEIYECLGTYVPGKFPYEWRTLTRGTCLSNDELFELKMQEIEEFVRKTHITALLLHNMDAYDLNEGLWATRCDACKKRWPNPSLFARDGMAGAFAEFIDKIIRRLKTVKDGDYDASRDLLVRMAAPGYMYYNSTNDEDFDVGVKFWATVTQYLEEKDRFIVGFREQFYYWDKPVNRTETVKNADFRSLTGVGNFNGCDGFYDDKLFTTTAAFVYSMKGYDGMALFNGNAFQEPLQVYNAEYLWNSESDGFYKISPKPTNYQDYTDMFLKMVRSQIRPDEVYQDGGFLDIICQKLYGDELGLAVAKLYKIAGKNGEPPIPYASNVDIFTNYSKAVYPMRWEEEMKEADIPAKKERFYECCLSSRKAYELLDGILCKFHLTEEQREKFTVFRECFYMGSQLCDLLHKYMVIYEGLHKSFANNMEGLDAFVPMLMDLKPQIDAFTAYVNETYKAPVDKFEGIFIRRKEMADFLDYNAGLMMASIQQKKRIPDGLRDEIAHAWW